MYIISNGAFEIKTKKNMTDNQFKIKVPGYCRECGKNNKPHKAKGQCTTCYARNFMRSKRDKEKEEKSEVVDK